MTSETRCYEIPEESNNYFTDKGWAYFDLKEGVFTQAGEEIKVSWYELEVDESEPCFSYQEIDRVDNLPDLLMWVHNNKMVAIVDESYGGIIGYVNSIHAERINALLNGRK